MQFAPYGVRVLARKAVSRTGTRISKSLPQQSSHTGVPGSHSFSTNRVIVSNVFTHSRNLLSRLFTRLLAPNIRIPLAPSLSGRALHTSVLHAPLGRAAIRQGFSFPVRLAVSRPLGLGSFIPRGPTAAQRVVTNLGIGSVRRFTSAQPFFQNLVENVPIAVRALYEAKIDAKPLHRHSARKTLRATETRSAKQTGKSLQFPQNVTTLDKVPSATSTEELEQYFPLSEPAVTTYLLVPLAPTPTSRMPLAQPAGPDLLHPLSELGDLHISHELHALRVSSLFSRLDHEDVWSKGVHCTAFAHGTTHIWENEGSCTILKLEFIGWSKAEVKGVIGECGTGWCILYEEHDELMDMESDLPSEPDEKDNSIDPAQSLVLPTLDLSLNSEVRSRGPEMLTQFSRSEAHLSSTDSVGDNANSEWYAYGLSSQFLDRANLPL